MLRLIQAGVAIWVVGTVISGLALPIFERLQALGPALGGVAQ